MGLAPGGRPCLGGGEDRAPPAAAGFETPTGSSEAVATAGKHFLVPLAQTRQ